MKSKFLKIVVTLKIYFLTLLSLFLITSCEETAKENLSGNSIKFESYKVIGLYHNQNLDYIFNNIQKKIIDDNLQNRSDNNDVQTFLTNDFIAQSVSNFSIENKILNFSSYNEEIRKTCLKVTTSYYPIDMKVKMNAKSTNNFSSDLENYNEFQIKYINMILNNESTNIESFQSKIDSIIIEMEKDNNLKSDERDIVYLAGAIAYGSFEYWFSNTSKWEELLSYNQGISNVKGLKISKVSTFNYKSMWRSDVEGGVGGGIGGAIAGGTVSLGALTVPGWIAGAVGGAVGTSAGNAVGQWLFD